VDENREGLLGQDNRAETSFSAASLEELLQQVEESRGAAAKRPLTQFDNTYSLEDGALLFTARFHDPQGNEIFRGVVLCPWGPRQIDGREALIPSAGFYQDHDGLLYRAALSYRLDVPLAIHGHTGVGKTELVRYLAWLLNAPLYRMNLHGLSTTDDIIGKLLPAGRGDVRFQDGLVTTAVRHGGVLLLEEMNATGQEIWFALHGLLDQSRALVLAEKDNEVLPQHRDCHIFATFNPVEYLSLYPGTKELSAAYLQRWSSVRIQFLDLALERRILLQRFPALGGEEYRSDLEAMLEVAALAREMLVSRPNAFPFVLSTGVLRAWASLLPHLGPLEAARMAFYDLLDERLKAVFREQVFAYATSWDVSQLEKD